MREVGSVEAAPWDSLLCRQTDATVSLRGLFDQQIHGSKRSLRSVEDFTEFEFRTAYF
jgi:hypothetical protein